MKKVGKKVVPILLVLLMLVSPFLSFFNTTYALEETDKKNPDSYWSNQNAPLFYGATKITIGKGSMDTFNMKDARFRIFAKDFEDGDLTPNITSSGKVDVNTPGTYELHYQVADSHNNESTLTVPVIVTEEETSTIVVERTLYTIPSVWNMDLAGFSRCNYGDRQILGVYMPAGSSIKARILDANNSITVQFLTNDSYKESAVNIPISGEWITLTNVSSKDGQSYDSVPLLTSTVLSREKTSLTKTFKIELEYDNTVEALTYYHYQDSEEDFFRTWRENQNTYSIIENEVLTIVTPFADIDKLVNHNLYSYGFKTLTEHLEYYQKAVDRMDELVGLDLNPEQITDQNVRTKYLIRPNAHGAGAAYYAGNHVGLNSSSISAFFQMNWGGLHELAHGYQGNLGKGEMQLGEVSNNILGHYIQVDKSIYFHPGDWLGDLAKIETSRNQGRLEGKTFTENDVVTRLYMVINLFDSLEGADTYAKMFSWYRKALNEGNIVNKNKNQDIYIEAIADIYHVDITPYMEAWGLEISEDTKEKVASKNYPLMTILNDMAKEESVEKIKLGENLDKKFLLVPNDIYKKYDITGNLIIHIDIDDIEELRGKFIQVKQGSQVVKTVSIDSTKVTIPDLNVGAYYLQMPINSNYRQSNLYVEVKENEDNTYTYSYEKLENITYDNYVTLRLLGIYDTYGYKITFSNNYKTTRIELGGANLSSFSKAEVKILDENGVIISDEAKGYDGDGNLSATGANFNHKKAPYEIEIKPGYRIEVTHSGYNYKRSGSNLTRVVWNSILTGEVIDALAATSETTVYIVEENGIRKIDMTQEDLDDMNYETLKTKLIEQIENYQEKVSEEEISNKNINFREKAEVINAYNHLKEEDQKLYYDFINQIKKGGTPVITVVGTLNYEVGDQVDLYSLIYVTDNEDGNIQITENTTKINTNLDNSKAGSYTVSYEVSDSDGNIASNSLEIIVKNIIEPTPSEEPKPSEKPTPSEEPISSEEPTPSEKPTSSIKPTPSIELTPSEEPKPSEEPTPSEEPKPSEEPTPSEKPTPSEEPISSEEPIPSEKPTSSIKPTPSIELTPSNQPSSSSPTPSTSNTNITNSSTNSNSRENETESKNDMEDSTSEENVDTKVLESEAQDSTEKTVNKNDNSMKKYYILIFLLILCVGIIIIIF